MSLFRRFFGNAASNSAGFAIGAAVHPTLRPLTQELANETWVRFPNIPLTPEQAAAAVERGEMLYAAAEDEAALTGTNAKRFKIIERLAGLAPSTEQLLTMRRRGAIDAKRMQKGFIQGNVRSEWADALAALAEVLLTPGEIARLTALDFITTDQGKALAAQIGVEPVNFDRLVQLAGDSPATDRLLTLWNRGEISETDVNRGLQQSGLRSEWFSAIKALRKHLPSPSDAIRFSVKDVFDTQVRARFGLDADFPQSFLPLAAQLGIDEEQARWYWAAHWRNVSPTQLYRMLHRGEITDDDLDAGLKVADYSPFWRDKLKQIAYLVPGRIDLRRFYAAGIITEDEVFAGYKKLGYTDQVARWQTDFAKKGVSSTAKDLTAANLRAEYEGSFIDRAALLDGLDKLGYDHAEAQMYANLGDAARVKKYREAVITAIYKAYLAHELRAAEAKAKLTENGIASEAQDELLRLWNLELSVSRKQLTPTQITASYRRGTISAQDAVAELELRGYTTIDAHRLLDLALPQLNVKQIEDAFVAGIITRAEAMTQLAGLGYTTEQANELLDTVAPPEVGSPP